LGKLKKKNLNFSPIIRDKMKNPETVDRAAGPRSGSRGFVFFLLVCHGLALFGAEITVPRLEIASRGRVINGDFSFATDAQVDIALEGGYKYGVILGLSFMTGDLGKALAYRRLRFDPMPGSGSVTAAEYNEMAGKMNAILDNQAVLSFRVAEATARDVFNLPLELSYFIGYYDSFCSGQEFADRYGLYYIPTDFTSFYYFPEGIGGDPFRRYNGIYEVQGTGLVTTLTALEKFVPMLYLYQSLPATEGGGLSFSRSRYSGDLRVILNLERFKLEAFGGITGGSGSNLQVRAGALAFFSSEGGADFLVQAGIPGWENGDDFGIDNLYFLVEPRIKIGILALHTTFFYHPLMYTGVKTAGERGRADVNIKFMFGDPVLDAVQGGAEFTFYLKAADQGDVNIWAGPFLKFVGAGLQWNFKFRLNILKYENPQEMFEFFVGVRTAY
jgi:hypothetical protein